MKSAYGRQTSAPDYELTCVEPGSPMGELMRRYWQPVCTSDELRDLSRKEKLLCEDIVVFRDKKGRVGALDPRQKARRAIVRRPDHTVIEVHWKLPILFRLPHRNPAIWRASESSYLERPSAC